MPRDTESPSYRDIAEILDVPLGTMTMAPSRHAAASGAVSCRTHQDSRNASFMADYACQVIAQTKA